MAKAGFWYHRSKLLNHRLREQARPLGKKLVNRFPSVNLLSLRYSSNRPDAVAGRGG